MCANFEPVIKRERLKQYFGVEAAAPCPPETWPGQPCHFIRPATGPDHPQLEAETGLYGLIPHWAKDLTIGRHTYNARSETVAELPSFRDAWRRSHHCIVPLEAFYEPNWETGKAIRWRIANADGTPMGVAGLWSAWHAPDDRWLFSVTLLTINADGHGVMQHFHKPEDEKRMVVILNPADYQHWLTASPDAARDLLQRYPANRLTTAPAPLQGKQPKSPKPPKPTEPDDGQPALF